jgi:hypothetical protein
VQSGAVTLLGGVGGTPDVITASASPAIAAYVAGQTFRFVSTGANTGATTINLNGLGARSITKQGTIALAAGDIPSGVLAEIVYDGTQFQLVNCISSTPTFSTLTVSGAANVGGNAIVGQIALPGGARTLQVVNTDPGATSSVTSYVQTNAGLLQLVMGTTAGGGTASVLCSASGVFNIYTTQAQNVQIGSNNRPDDIIITPAGVVLTGGVTSAPTNYTTRGDVAIPAARGVRANNTAKAWVRFDGTPVGSYPITLTAVDSFGVASITKNAVGDYTINFAAGIFADANYCAVGTAGSTSVAGFYTFRGPVQSTPTATAYRCRVSDSAPNYIDVNHISIAFFGD